MITAVLSRQSRAAHAVEERDRYFPDLVQKFEGQVTKNEMLRDLPSDFTPEDVDAIVGNNNMTRVDCDDCQKSVDRVILITDEYDRTYIRLCKDCLTELAEKL